jgi:hypothetical protein
MALEAAYAFDGTGTTVTDLSGNGRDLNLTGTNGVQVSGGQTGNALGKTGTTMPVLPSAVLAACQTDDRTIMFDDSDWRTVTWLAGGVFGVLVGPDDGILLAAGVWDVWGQVLDNPEHPIGKQTIRIT